MSKVSCNQRVFIAINPGRIPLHMQSTCGKYVYVLVCANYLCAIHIIDAYSSTTRKNASPSIYVGGLRGGEGPKKNTFFPLPPLSLREAIYIYTHYVCFSSFLFPGDLHDSLDILWQPLRKSDNLCGSLVVP